VTTIPVSRLKKRWMKGPGFKAGYDALQEEFTIASVLIEARVRANLSQQQLAERMGTSQSTIARLESGTAKPSFTTLERIAKATKTRVRISLEPTTQPRNCKPRSAA
jgi:ribosome-binding protein aMBF1 (putative translation factor)